MPPAAVTLPVIAVTALTVLLGNDWLQADGFHPQVSLVRPPGGAFRAGEVHVVSPVLLRSSHTDTACLAVGLSTSTEPGDVLDSVTVAVPTDPASIPRSSSPVLTDRWRVLPTVHTDVPVSPYPPGSVQRIGGRADPAVGVVDPDGTISTGVFADVVLRFRHAGSVHVPALVLPSRSRGPDGDCT
jgi:hypothetical protein